MNRLDYERYLEMFNKRDYHGVLEHFAEHFDLVFAGYVFHTREEVLNFYKFLHAHVNESVVLKKFVSDGTMVALEADIRLEALSDVTEGMLADQGMERIAPMKKGQVITIPQFIHYHLENGKITRALCTVYEPPNADMHFV